MGIEPRVSGTAHGAAQCDTTTPQPLVFFSISMWVNLSLASPGRHNFADVEHVGRAGRKCLGRNFVDVGRCHSPYPDSIGE